MLASLTCKRKCFFRFVINTKCYDRTTCITSYAVAAWLLYHRVPYLCSRTALRGERAEETVRVACFVQWSEQLHNGTHLSSGLYISTYSMPNVFNVYKKKFYIYREWLLYYCCQWHVKYVLHLRSKPLLDLLSQNTISHTQMPKQPKSTASRSSFRATTNKPIKIPEITWV